LEIKVPANAAPGGYYGVVRFTATAPEGATSSVSLAPSLGALILVRVKGTATEKLSIEEFYVEKNGKRSTFFEEIPFDFVERVNNEGNVHEQPTGTILVKDMFGKPVVNINVNGEARNVLPKSIRKFSQPMDKAALGTGVLFGRYTAELKLNYGDKLSTTQTLVFWVIPWRLILLGLFLLIVAIIAIRAAILRYNERLLGRSRQSRRR
jgi:nucleoside diphosphate kinase